MTKTIKSLVPETDVVLMGAGIMSATLGMILKELNPDITIWVFERLDEPGTESSDAWSKLVEEPRQRTSRILKLI